MGNTVICVIVAHDEDLIRSGLRRLLEDYDDIDVRDTCRRAPS
ncbi:hypothetical protein PV367_01220 [Streptomyces europaeiscabiei]|uniref:Uncharacterized protein n=1 Tax=Streptomyces europaeiscabiei TaxID=146819 RepID=A0AAJ2PJ85_9ACTN|nr:hypothetical protein [Streptomyces europaeiscabiei]MDX3128449.1 hypothetical protein [Streptomyces europaeiscabiei]